MKSVFVKCAGFGAGFAVTICAIIGIGVYIVSLPKPLPPWNQTAITTAFSEFTFNLGDNPTLNFAFIANNTTDRDYNVPTEKENLFVVLPAAKALYQYNNSPEPFLQTVAIDPSSIPAGQRAIVTIHLILLYNEFFSKADRDREDKVKMMQYVAKRLERLDGFKIFDKTNWYEIDFANGWKTTQHQTGK